MLLINCKVELSLNWIENCVLTSAPIGDNVNATGADSTTFKITDAKLYVPVVTLSITNNAKLSKLLSEGFKKPFLWNKYQVIPNKILQTSAANATHYRRNFFIQVIKESNDCLFLFIIIQTVIIKLLFILSKNIFFQELK